jgi:hypothetical protein
MFLNTKIPFVIKRTKTQKIVLQKVLFNTMKDSKTPFSENQQDRKL